MTEITDFVDNYPTKTKRCRNCFKDKPLSHFCKRSSSPDGFSLYWYNISIKEQKELIQEQNGKCAICGKQITLKDSHLDHDHKTEKVRAYLCFLCNNMLGLARDNTLILAKAIQYLREK